MFASGMPWGTTGQKVLTTRIAQGNREYIHLRIATYIHIRIAKYIHIRIATYLHKLIAKYIHIRTAACQAFYVKNDLFTHVSTNSFSMHFLVSRFARNFDHHSVRHIHMYTVTSTCTCKRQLDPHSVKTRTYVH
jgi:hypothetical protein